MSHYVKLRKGMYVLLTAVMCAGCFAGCGNKTASVNESDTAAKVQVEGKKNLEEWIGTYVQKNWESDAAMNQETPANVIVYKNQEDQLTGTFYDGIDTYVYLFDQITMNEDGTVLTLSNGQTTLELSMDSEGYQLMNHPDDCYDVAYDYEENDEQVIEELNMAE